MSNEEQTLEAPPSPAERTAVVVEDDQIIVTLLEHLLSRRGFNVRIALDGRQATDFMDTLASPPSLVLLDVMLPYLDGFEIIKRIREHATWNQVPIIMLTSKSQEQNIVRALDYGANDYLVKPFRPEELLARIRRVTKLS
jgi:two-component system alkaline phosphatase synthesis response regulator PhoP